jgi:heme-degrading monooxygenase HmoA
MENPNAPVIHIAARTFKPEDEERHRQFYEKWFYEAYIPLLSNATGIRGVDSYRIVEENPKYPKYMMIFHFSSLKDFQDFNNNAELNGVRRAGDANFPGQDYAWYAQYQLTQSWRK